MAHQSAELDVEAQGKKLRCYPAAGAWLMRLGFYGLLLACAVGQAAAGRTLNEVWNEEFQELKSQITQLKTADPKWRQRLQAEALDLQASIQPTDADPLAVALRRTAALLDHCRRKEPLPAPALGRFESRLQALRHGILQPGAGTNPPGKKHALPSSQWRCPKRSGRPRFARQHYPLT